MHILINSTLKTKANIFGAGAMWSGFTVRCVV